MARSGVVNVYVEKITPRVAWAFDLFEEMLGVDFSLFEDADAFRQAGSAYLNYSSFEFPELPSIIPAGILMETGIQKQEIKVSKADGLPVFYQTQGGSLNYDPIAMAFYLVSRYEEYLPFTQDQHGRFPHTESLAWKEGFLDKPLVNQVADQIRTLLLKYYPDLRFEDRSYSFLPTVDVDIAYAHLGKGFLRTYGAMAKLLLKGKTSEIKRRILSMQGKTDDPYNNFDFLQASFSKKGMKPIYFILAGDPGPHDRNLSTKNKKVSELIRRLSESANIGIHPSYRSGDDPARVKMEMERISKAIEKPITLSRQHYVRMRFPDTYRILINNGIKEDYSMGYASISGFRASIANPFTFYDLGADKATELRVFPFMFMDSTMSDYMHLDPQEYAGSAQSIIEEVKNCNGKLCAIWHNYAMADDPDKKQAFQDILNLASKE